MPLCIIPCGTGNGMAASLGISHKHIDEVVSCISGRSISPVDCITVTTSGVDAPKEILSFLSVTWGMVADHDRLTEVEIRWMGPMLAMALAPVSVVLHRRMYDGKIAFVPHAGKPVPSVANYPGKKLRIREDGWVEVDGPFHGLICSSVPRLATDVLIAPRARVDDALIHVIIFYAPLSRFDYARIMLGFDSGEHVKMSGVDIFEATQVDVSPSPGGEEFISVDGELIPSQNLKLAVNPSLLRFFVTPKAATTSSTCVKTSNSPPV